MAAGTVLLFSLLMFALPLGTFFSAWNGRLDPLLAPLLGHALLDDSRLTVAAVLAILAVNGVLAAFVTAAWLEAPPPPKPESKRE